jgi:hypothetical protein
MSAQAAPIDPQTLAPPTPARSGAFGGLCAGVVAGAVGGGGAAVMADLGVVNVDHFVRGAALGAAGVGAAAALAGALLGALTARRGRRAPFLWSFGTLFWSSLVATVEAGQGDWLSAARTFILGTALLVGLVALAAWLRPILWKLRWLLLGWLALCLVGEGYSRLYPKSFTPLSSPPDEPVAQLWYGPLPTPLNVLAVHYWLVTFDPAEGRWHRWDLWQEKNVRPPSWGHVHKDLMDPDAWYGGGPGRPEQEWRGDEARAIISTLARSPEYPHRDGYVAWPGPNSNTYIAWALREAGVSADMDPRAIGRDYRGRAGAGLTTTRTGVQAESSLLGGKAGLKEGVELHFLTFTFGVGTGPPAIKTPLGRIGFAE